MSVELRVTWQGVNNIECEWGVVSNPCPDLEPLRREPRKLMLITPDVVHRIIQEPQERDGGISSVTSDGDRIFVNLKAAENHWVWELFEAHWEDGEGPEILIGRWPD